MVLDALLTSQTLSQPTFQSLNLEQTLLYSFQQICLKVSLIKRKRVF